MMDRIFDAGRRYMKKMDLEDMAALKICLLCTGALLGLSVGSRKAARTLGVLTGLTAVGLGIPLVAGFMDEVNKDPEIVQVQDVENEEKQ